MKKILILGSTGDLGKVLLGICLEKNYSVNVLVRDKIKVSLSNENLKIFEGQVTKGENLSEALSGVDVVISVLGHGFRSPYPIQENVMKILIPLMEKHKVKRLITITGAGLKTSEDPNSLTLAISERILNLVDPYRINDARVQQDLIEKSNLDWTIVRTPVHVDKGNLKIKHAGYRQPKLWQRISRIAISNFMIEVIEENEWIKKSPIIF